MDIEQQPRPPPHRQQADTASAMVRHGAVKAGKRALQIRENAAAINGPWRIARIEGDQGREMAKNVLEHHVDSADSTPVNSGMEG